MVQDTEENGWQPVPRNQGGARCILQCTTAGGQQVFCFTTKNSQGVFRSERFSSMKEAALKGRKAWEKWKKRKARESISQHTTSPAQQLHQGQLLQASTASVDLPAPSTDRPWDMHVPAATSMPGQQDGAIHVKHIKRLSKGYSSVVWSVSVPVCGSHGLSALAHPSDPRLGCPSLTRLLAQHKCCGRCSTLANLDSSNSSSADGMQCGSAVHAEASCSCSSCNVQLAFKYAQPFEHLRGDARKDHGSAEAYLAAVRQGYAMEWDILTACSGCDNIVSAYAVGELPGGKSHPRPCMLLELAALGSADVALKPTYSVGASQPISRFTAGSMSALQAQHITRQVAVGLAAVHAVPAVYCDLKAANLLLFGDPAAPVAKLTDFTTSFKVQGVTQASPGVTKGWAGPEVFRSRPSISKAFDIWSLGVLLLWLREGPLVCVYDADMQLACALHSKFTPVEQDFLKCCLCMEPTERWTAARLLQEHPYMSQEYQGG